MKTKKELLKAYKKANKKARVRIAINAGFDSTEDYLKHLNKGIERDKELSQNVVIHNVHILDASASMSQGNKFNKAYAGIQKEYEVLSLDKNNNYINSYVHFGWDVDITTWRQDNFDFNPLVKVNRGSTSLYDALGITLTKLIEGNKENERVLVKIFTDGQENSSRKFISSEVSSLIKTCKELGFTITFVGTEMDVFRVKNKLNIDDSNTNIHDNTASGVELAFNTSLRATRQYATKVSKGASKDELLTGFYKQTGEL